MEPGDRVALLSRTRYEWTLFDYAILAVGGVTVPIYETSSAEQIAWILTDSGAVAVVVESGKHRRLVDGAPMTARPAHVWQIEADARTGRVRSRSSSPSARTCPPTRCTPGGVPCGPTTSPR